MFHLLKCNHLPDKVRHDISRCISSHNDVRFASSPNHTYTSTAPYINPYRNVNSYNPCNAISSFVFRPLCRDAPSSRCYSTKTSLYELWSIDKVRIQTVGGIAATGCTVTTAGLTADSTAWSMAGLMAGLMAELMAGSMAG